MSVSQAINRFYIVLAIVLVVLAGMVIISLRVIFSSLSLAAQVDEELLSSKSPRVDTAKVDEAIRTIEDKKFTPLDL